MAILILIAGPLAAVRTPTDIFPNIGIPVIGVAFQYTGLSPDEMSGRYRHPVRAHPDDDGQRYRTHRKHVAAGHGHREDLLPAQRRHSHRDRAGDLDLADGHQSDAAGVTPPLILNYNASTVPILQLAGSSPTQSEQQVLDLMQNFVRPLLATFPARPFPTLMAAAFAKFRSTSTRKRCRPRVYRRKTSRTRSPRKTRSFPPVASRSVPSSTP